MSAQRVQIYIKSKRLQQFVIYIWSAVMLLSEVQFSCGPFLLTPDCAGYWSRGRDCGPVPISGQGLPASAHQDHCHDAL